MRACALSTVTPSALISKLFLSVPGARRLISSLSRNKRKLLSFRATDEAKIFPTFSLFPPSNRHRRTFNSDLKTLAEGGGENTSETLSACLPSLLFFVVLGAGGPTVRVEGRLGHCWRCRSTAGARCSQLSSAPSAAVRCGSECTSKSSALSLRPFMAWAQPTSANWLLFTVQSGL